MVISRSLNALERIDYTEYWVYTAVEGLVIIVYILSYIYYFLSKYI
jgi:hypothetical protein